MIGIFFRAIAKVLAVLFLTLSIINPFPTFVHASGFALYSHGAKEVGMLNNAISHTMGPASNYYNPALITELEGIQIEIGTSFTFGSRKFKSLEYDQTFKPKRKIYSPSAMLVTYKFNDKIAAGIGITNTFGTGVDWGKTWEGRYSVTKSEMKTYNINPNIARKISDNLSIAIGFDYTMAETIGERNIDLSPYGLADGEMKLDFHGAGYGYNLGLIFHSTQGWAFGVSYRSKISLDMDDGSVNFTLPNTTPTALQSQFPNTGADTSIDLPAQMFAGLSYQGTDNFIVEAGIRWEEWSQYDTLSISFDEAVLGSKTIKIQKKYKNALSFSFGAKYDLNNTIAFVTGFRHEENPVPAETYEPSVMGNDKNSFGLGIIGQLDNFDCSVSYLYEVYESRTVYEPALSPLTPSGDYEGSLHMIHLSFAYKIL